MGAMDEMKLPAGYTVETLKVADLAPPSYPGCDHDQSCDGTNGEDQEDA